jgi:hypothetical protein
MYTDLSRCAVTQQIDRHQGSCMIFVSKASGVSDCNPDMTSGQGGSGTSVVTAIRVTAGHEP